MLVSDISLRVKRLFGDSANVQIADDDIIRWINDALRDICLTNQLLQAIATTPVVVGQTNYTLPADMLTLRSIKVNGIKIDPLSLSEAEENIPNFDDTANYPTGIPTTYWIWANQFNLYPNPGTAGTIRIYYTRQPVQVSAVTDTPELPQQYHNRIVEYCLAQAYELDENWSAAQTKQAQFDKGVDRLKDNVDWIERDSYPHITSTDNDHFGFGYANY